MGCSLVQQGYGHPLHDWFYSADLIVGPLRSGSRYTWFSYVLAPEMKLRLGSRALLRGGHSGISVTGSLESTLEDKNTKRTNWEEEKIPVQPSLLPAGVILMEVLGFLGGVLQSFVQSLRLAA